MNERTFQELATDLAATFPERFFWLPESEGLRVLTTGQQREDSPYCYAFPYSKISWGLIFVALSEECEVRGWHSQHRRAAYTAFPFESTISPDWDRTSFVGDGHTYAWAFADAMLQCAKTWVQP